MKVRNLHTVQESGANTLNEMRMDEDGCSPPDSGHATANPADQKTQRLSTYEVSILAEVIRACHNNDKFSLDKSVDRVKAVFAACPPSLKQKLNHTRRSICLVVTDLTELMDATNFNNVEALTFPMRAVMDDINMPGAPQPAPAANLNQILHCRLSVKNPTSVIKMT